MIKLILIGLFVLFLIANQASSVVIINLFQSIPYWGGAAAFLPSSTIADTNTPYGEFVGYLTRDVSLNIEDTPEDRDGIKQLQYFSKFALCHGFDMPRLVVKIATLSYGSTDLVPARDGWLGFRIALHVIGTFLFLAVVNEILAFVGRIGVFNSSTGWAIMGLVSVVAVIGQVATIQGLGC